MRIVHSAGSELRAMRLLPSSIHAARQQSDVASDAFAFGAAGLDSTFRAWSGGELVEFGLDDLPMHLSPREIDKLLLHNAGFLAQKRLARGVRLNHPESVALIATQLLEFIRDGRSVAELMNLGRKLLGRRQVMEGVAEMVTEVQVEGTFPDGTKLVTVHHPIASDHGDLALALYGSFLPVPTLSKADSAPESEGSVPGACEPLEGELELNAGRATVSLSVTNLGDRPVQVGSHYHFVETNAQLRFDRAKAYGYRLDIPAGTAVRFEPGESKTVKLVAIAGARVIRGGNALADGPVSTENLTSMLARAKAGGFQHQDQE